MEKLTVLEVVEKAVIKTGSHHPETVLTETVRMGYVTKRANDVVRAIKTLLTGEKFDSNNRKCNYSKPVENPVDTYHLQYARNYNNKYRDRCNKRNQERSAERKAKGLCPKCGRVPVDGKTHCETCLERFRGYNKGKTKRVG